MLRVIRVQRAYCVFFNGRPCSYVWGEPGIPDGWYPNDQIINGTPVRLRQPQSPVSTIHPNQMTQDIHIPTTVPPPAFLAVYGGAIVPRYW